MSWQLLLLWRGVGSVILTQMPMFSVAPCLRLPRSPRAPRSADTRKVACKRRGWQGVGGIERPVRDRHYVSVEAEDTFLCEVAVQMRGGKRWTARSKTLWVQRMRT